MAKTFSLKNAKDLKTTVLGVIAAGLAIAGAVWPDKINAETSEIINTAAGEILMGVGALIGVYVSIFGKD